MTDMYEWIFTIDGKEPTDADLDTAPKMTIVEDRLQEMPDDDLCRCGTHEDTDHMFNWEDSSHGACDECACDGYYWATGFNRVK